MGYLHYGQRETFEFDDRTLTHLRTVILGKMNLQESLVFTWVDGARQHSIWIHPATPLHFEFEAAATPDIDPEWLEYLLECVNSPAGLRITKEPDSKQ